MTTIIKNQEIKESKIKEGIDFLLYHFEGRQRLFPRKMSTFASNGKQFTVYNKEQILNACIISNFRDCRLNAYPVLEEGLLQAPNIIFIDIDLQDNLKELERILKKTLKIIKQKLNGFEPTVLWTGNGYHIYIVLDIRPLEIIIELKGLSYKPSEQFLRFAEDIFTNIKGDKNHKPSFKSCLLRIPGTINSKNNSEVKIIQKFDVNNIPIVDNQLIREFRLYLTDIDIGKRIAESRKNQIHVSKQDKHQTEIQYAWIEKLLETPIEDGRKYAMWKILCPYLVNIKRLEYEESFKILKAWLELCNISKSLGFNPDIEIKNKLKYAIHFNPISISTFKTDNRILYLRLMQKKVL